MFTNPNTVDHERVVDFEDIAGNVCGGYSHLLYKGIFPVSARDFVTLSFRYRDADGCWWTPNLSIDLPDLVPDDPNTSTVRAAVIIGGYKVEPMVSNVLERVMMVVLCNPSCTMR